MQGLGDNGRSILDRSMKLLHFPSSSLNRFFIVKTLEGAFNKEKALVGAFSGHCEISRRFVDNSSAGCILVDNSDWVIISSLPVLRCWGNSLAAITHHTGHICWHWDWFQGGSRHSLIKERQTRWGEFSWNNLCHHFRAWVLYTLHPVRCF